MDPNQVNALVARHGWKVALGAFFIGAIVRLLKADATIVPVVVPARWRPLVVWALSLVGLALEHFVNGTPWNLAAIMALIAGGGAMAGHDTVIKAIFGGREIPMPKPPNDGAALVLLGALALVGASSCTPAKGAEDIARDIARGSVLVAVEAVDIADVVCANIAVTAKGSEDEDKLRKGIDLAQKCARAKDAALIAAKSASLAIKAWGSAAAGKLACAAVQILEGLNLVRDAAVRFGQPIPVELEDGISSAARLARFLPNGASCDLKAAP
jgi:hypothetical protein